MSKLFVFSFLTLCSITVSAQTDLEIAESYFDKLEVKTKLPHFTNRFIDKKARVRPEVPDSVWEDIKGEMDYSLYKNSAVQVLMEQLSIEEMQNAIDENESHIPILNLELRVRLQEKIIELEEEWVRQINSTLEANGYSLI